MSNELAETAKELTLLGWSEEGATNYSNLLDTNKLQIFSSSPYNLSIILIILFLFILIYISTKRYLDKPKEIYLLEKSIAINKNIISMKNNSIVQTKASSNEPESLTKDNHKIKKDLTNKNSIIKILEYIKVLKAEKDTNNKKVSKNIVKVNKTPLNDHLKSFLQDTSIDTKSLEKAILKAFVITFDLSSKLLKLSLNDSYKKNYVTKDPNKQKSVPKSLHEKSDNELRNMLKGVELLPKLNRDQLLALISSSPLILEKIASEEKEATLMSKTKVELKSILKGVPKISQLSKKELAKKILSLEIEI